MSGHEEWDELAAGYALHALEPEDEARFAAHLSACPRCRVLRAEVEAVAAELGASLPADPPPPELRARLLAAAQRERPASHDAAGERGAPLRPPVDDSGQRPKIVDAHRVERHGLRRPPGRGDAPAPRRGRSVAQRAAAAVAGLAVVISLATTAVLADRRADERAEALARQQAVLQLVAQPDARTIALVGDGGASGRAVVHDRHLYLLADGLPLNDRSRSVYVLWGAQPGGGLVGVAKFDATRDGVTVVDAGRLPEDLAGSSVFAVSYERGREVPEMPSASIVLRRA